MISQYSQSSSPLLLPESDRLVGTLYRWNPASQLRTDPFPVYYHQELYIGRDPARCQYVIDYPVISHRHVRIYTIIYDRDNPGEVAPLVYAQDLSLNGTWWNGVSIRKHTGAAVLLSDGDVLQLSPDFYFLFRSPPNHMATLEPFTNLQELEMKVFQSEYRITNRKLGAGAYGQVHLAIDTRSGRQVACKMVNFRALLREMGEKTDLRFPRLPLSASPPREIVAGNHAKDLLKKQLKFHDREVKILQKLRHPNIISMERVIRSENTLYIFQELITAGDLFSFVEYKGGKLRGLEAAVIVRQILMALEYLHEQNIIHRDLKPDNILMTSLVDGCRVVLSDFGCARLVESNSERMSTMVGTLEYTAPEVVEKTIPRGYTKSVDMWSLGCVTVVILTGSIPFRDAFTFSFSPSKARQCDLDNLRADAEWQNVGHHPKDFVYQLLVLDERQRMDVKMALTHVWFSNPIHKMELDEIYRRATRDWKPRAVQKPIIFRTDDMEELPERTAGRGHVRASRSFHRSIESDLGIDPPPKKRCCNQSSDILLDTTVFQRSDAPSPIVPRVESRFFPLDKPTCFEKGASRTLLSSDYLPDTDKVHTQAKESPQLIVADTEERGHAKSQSVDREQVPEKPPESRKHLRRPFSPQAWSRRGAGSNSSGNSWVQDTLDMFRQYRVVASPMVASKQGERVTPAEDRRTEIDSDDACQPTPHQRSFDETSGGCHTGGPEAVDVENAIYDDEVYEEESTFSGTIRRYVYGSRVPARRGCW